MLYLIKKLLSPIKYHFLLSYHQAQWRNQNKHNLTFANNLFPRDKVSVGNNTYGALNIFSFGNPEEKLIIGHYVSIASNVSFIIGGEHQYKRCTNYPFPKIPYAICCDASTKGPIVVEDDVWVGFGCIILSGVTIGKGAVIAAGSIVVKDVPPYSIFAHGTVVKYRFSEEIIEKVSKINFSKVDNSVLKRYKNHCQEEVTNDNVDDIVQLFL